MASPDQLSKKFLACAREIGRARKQSRRPKHLYVHVRRVAIRATRLVLDSADEAPFIRELKNFSIVFKDLRPDHNVIAFWKLSVLPALRARSPSSFAADAGAFDFPKAKLDAKGRVLGRDGKPLRKTTKRDRKGRIVSGSLSGEIALITDDYDDTDTLEHLRAQALDWQNACEVLAEMARERLEVEVDEVVTMSQIGAFLSVSKRTVENWRNADQIPPPDIHGVRGTAHKWYWSKVRPHLEKLARRPLPLAFPGSRILPPG